MLSFEGGSDTAVVVLHEIYGINQHMLDACAEYRSLGYDVFCPNLLQREAPFLYESRDEAYADFVARVGFGSSSVVAATVGDLRTRYARVFLVGYSVGATLAWIAAASAPCDGVVCHYGTRIRDYSHLEPLCPALLLMAARDEAFPASMARERFEGILGVALEVLEGEHGFCDKHGPGYHVESAERAARFVRDFLSECAGSGRK